jgi:hypothetical protein
MRETLPSRTHHEALCAPTKAGASAHLRLQHIAWDKVGNAQLNGLAGVANISPGLDANGQRPQKVAGCTASISDRYRVGEAIGKHDPAENRDPAGQTDV